MPLEPAVPAAAALKMIFFSSVQLVHRMLTVSTLIPGTKTRLPHQISHLQQKALGMNQKWSFQMMWDLSREWSGSEIYMNSFISSTSDSKTKCLGRGELGFLESGIAHKTTEVKKNYSPHKIRVTDLLHISPGILKHCIFVFCGYSVYHDSDMLSTRPVFLRRIRNWYNSKAWKVYH